MFEFFVFHAGGLVLWPANCDNHKTASIINEYIQGQLLEGRSTQGAFVRQKIAAYTRHDTENDLFFCATVNNQIAQQITYMDELLSRVQEAFLDSFDRYLSRKDQMMLTPSMFAKFNVDLIVDDFRGRPTKIVLPKPSKEPLTPAPPLPRAGSSDDVRAKNVKHHWSAGKFDQVAQDNSVVIGKARSTSEDVEAVEQYNLDDFEGVFRPPQKTASGLVSLFNSLIGEKVLGAENLVPVLEQFEQHLIAKNVAAHIAKQLTQEVQKNLVGSKCGTFSNVRKIVISSLRVAIERILTPDRVLDLIRDIQNCKTRGEPYVMAFVGVNGVGKTTSIAKVAYLFKSHGFKVLITACDTFRNGAIDQLKVHSDRLDIDLFQKGGGRRDPVPVAKMAKEHAKQNNYDVVLIDTAGRMQNDVNLMKQIANLINQVKPDLTVFVAEALVGNNGSDQIRQFDATIAQHGGVGAKGLDGIILTKFDTVDDKVGAALTLVFETGHPIVYLGVGQHYRDLRRMQPDFVVSTLLQGF